MHGAPTWERVQPGWYEAEAGGVHWRIVQTAGSRWEVLRREPPFAVYDVDAEWPHTLAEAKLYVADEVRTILDPEFAERRARRRQTPATTRRTA